MDNNPILETMTDKELEDRLAELLDWKEEIDRYEGYENPNKYWAVRSHILFVEDEIRRRKGELK